MKYLLDEIAASHRLMERLKVAAAGSEERIQKLKKEVGIIDLPRRGYDDPDCE